MEGLNVYRLLGKAGLAELVGNADDFNEIPLNDSPSRDSDMTSPERTASDAEQKAINTDAATATYEVSSVTALSGRVASDKDEEPLDEDEDDNGPQQD